MPAGLRSFHRCGDSTVLDYYVSVAISKCDFYCATKTTLAEIVYKSIHQHKAGCEILVERNSSRNEHMSIGLLACTPGRRSCARADAASSTDLLVRVTLSI